jgi:hypothetical protein
MQQPHSPCLTPPLPLCRPCSILSQLYKMGLKLVRLLDENKQLKEELVLERQAPGAARPAGEAAAGAAGADELRKRK